MNAWKYLFSILEVVEADKSLLDDYFVEEYFRRIVCGDPGWNYKSRASSWLN